MCVKLKALGGPVRGGQATRAGGVLRATSNARSAASKHTRKARWLLRVPGKTSESQRALERSLRRAQQGPEATRSLEEMHVVLAHLHRAS